MTARSAVGGGLGSDFEMAGGLQVAHTPTSGGADASEDGTGRGPPLVLVIAPTLTSKMAKGTGGPAGDECQNLVIGSLTASGAGNAAGTDRRDGRQSQLVVEKAKVFNNTDYKSGEFTEDKVANPLTTSADRTRSAPILAFSSKDSGHDVGEVAPTLRSGNHDKSHAGGGSPPAVVIPIQEIGRRMSGTHRNGVGHGKDGDPMFTVRLDLEVRRLTPLECERLQGFPDGWTEGFSDAVRYRMLGNAVAVPNVEWIARRLAKALGR